MMTDAELKDTYSLELIGEKLIKLSFLKVVSGLQDDNRLSQLIEESAREILISSPKTVFDILVDMTALGMDNRITAKSRKIYAALIKDPQCGRLAMVGSNAFFTTMINFIVRAAGATDRMRMFKTEADAKKWLQE